MNTTTHLQPLPREHDMKSWTILKAAAKEVGPKNIDPY